MNKGSTIPLHSGNRMPVIGFGTWKLTNQTAKTVEAALDAGYPMIDTSGDYGTQPGIREGLKRSGLDRDQYYIVTKVEETDDAYRAAKKNVRELGLEFADLLLIHRPPSDGSGVELWEGLNRAKRDGLTKDIGVSNYDESEIDELVEETGKVPVVNQIEWSPFGYSVSMFDYCKDRNIAIQAYSPLTHNERLDDESLEDLADRYKKTPAQILLRWDLQLGVAPLPKANSYDHLRENIDIFDFELNNDDMAYLCSLNEAYSALGSLPYV